TQNSDGEYHDSDVGFEGETAGAESGHDDFDDGDSGHNGMHLHVQGSVTTPDGSFSGTVLYDDSTSGTYHDHDWGPDTDSGGNIDETDNFDDGSVGHASFLQSIQGTVHDPDSGFTGTVNYSDSSPDSTYHNSDIGLVTDEEENGTVSEGSGHDNFDD